MTSWPDTRDSLLLRLGTAEDRAAWDDFVSLYQPLIYRYARGRGVQDADSRDVTQRVLCAVARAAETWKPGHQHGRFRGWLATVTRNAVIDLVKRRKTVGSGRTSMMESLDRIPAPDDRESDDWNQEYRRQLLRHAARVIHGDFSPEVWQAFWETAIDQRPVAEVAKELGKSVGMVYTARSRVMRRIRDMAQRIESIESQAGQSWFEEEKLREAPCEAPSPVNGHQREQDHG